MRILLPWRSRNLRRIGDLGLTCFRRGQFERAAECFEQVVRERRDPRHPEHREALVRAVEARMHLGLAHVHARRYAQAEAALSRALALSPGYPRLRYYRARVFQRMGRVREAIADLEGALELEPGESELHLLLAACHGRGNREGASQALDRALALAMQRPVRGSARSALPSGHRIVALRDGGRGGGVGPGTDCGLKRQIAEAIESMGRAVRRRPGYADLRYRLAGLWLEAGHLERAEIELECALRINPRYLAAHSLSAQLRLLRGRARLASRRLEEVLEVHPDYPDLHFWLGLARFRRGRPKGAIRALERAVALNRHFARAQRLLGLLHHGFGRSQEALRFLGRGFARDRELDGHTLEGGGPLQVIASGTTWGGERAVALRPDYPDLHLELARVLRTRGELEPARESCLLALGLKPDYEGAGLELARLELAMGRPEAAERLLADLVRRVPHWADAHALLGRSRRLKGDRGGTGEALGEALRLNPDDAEARQDMAWAEGEARC